MENKILGGCSCRHAELDSASAVIKRSVMPEGSYPASSYLMNDEIPNQVRDDSRGGTTIRRRSPIETLGDANRKDNGEMLNQVQHDGALELRDDNKKYNSHSKLDLESHRFFNNNGFTLIELLVVVLIIGILAAVALPQYQKAVEKSRAEQAFAMIRTVAMAQEAYHMANGTYANNFDELDVDIPWSGTTKWIAGSSSRAYSNEDWSLQFYKEASGEGISVGRISGPYAGAGFIYLLENVKYNFPLHQILCLENTFYEGSGSVMFPENKKYDYCTKIFKTAKTNFAPVP